MRARPIKNGAQFIPIVHALKRNGFHGSASHNHTIEFLFPQSLKILIEHHHVLYRSVFGCMGTEFHEVNLHLQRRVGEQPDKVGLRGNLQRHKVEDNNPQGTDILIERAALVHDEDILTLQQLDGR